MKENNILVKLTGNNKKQKVSLGGPFGFFIWALKIEVVILIIFIIAIFIYAKIPNENKFYIKYEISRVFFKSHENKDNVDTEVLANSLNNNETIKDSKEKEFIINLFEKELNENKEYIDIEKISKKLSSFETNNYYTKKGNVAGSYNAIFNEIKIYKNNVSNESFENMTQEEKQIYFHELNHLMTDYSLSSSVKSLSSDIDVGTHQIISKKSDILFNTAIVDYKINSDNIISELVNELYSREYFSSYDETFSSNAYADKIPYIYVLLEIIDDKYVREFKFNDNISVLTDGLLNIDNNRSEAFKLINSINKVDLLDDKDAKRDLYDSFSYFYNKKYNKDMSEDLTILCYLYNTGILNKQEEEKVQNYLKIKDNSEFRIEEIIPKGYISDDYKIQHENLIVKYNNNGIKQKEISNINI